MSLCGKLEKDVPIRASASKFHEMFHKKPHHICNCSTDKIHGVELQEGEWGQVGSIICWKYFHEGKHKIAKEIVEHVDEENNSITFKVIEGDLTEHYKDFRFTIKCIPKEKGSVIHWVLEYEKLHDKIPDSHTLLQFCVDVSKDIDKQLSAN
ncbi:MLP-like protein 43 [Cucumis sativus]|uniref:Csf-2 protein n=1 Tax=Cucumis sativus TaxID=3659 RepID=Q9SXL8_CUCSA|nr:MLP-like protein 43 [Cucumis sativus]KGN57231.1 hypothetical protein Csa_011769 [Cucumis sativus]BAA83470.1 Csf-2 [Cucumis sativus]